jgi:hypothetical protein
MRYSHMDKLFTPEGLIVSVVTMALTLYLCRPRKAKIQMMTTTQPGGASLHLQFDDTRQPHELRCLLEHQHMTRFTPEVSEGRLNYLAVVKGAGLPCQFRLVYEAATPNFNDYSLHMEMSWAHLPAEQHDDCSKSSGSWFQFWAQAWGSSSTQAPEEEVAALYPVRVAQALNAESALADVASIQREILSALQAGATFTSAHKEGGTRIGHAQGRHYRRDFGESTAERTFPTDCEFLVYLRQYFDGDLARGNGTTKISEEDAWMLILRRLDRV